MKLIDKQNRKVLGEGRNYGLGFAFAKMINPETFETVQPISPCKDYLNDVVFSEHTDKPCKAYGLHYTKQNIFTDNYAFLVGKECHYSDGRPYANFSSDEKKMRENIQNLLILLHNAEDILGFKDKTQHFFLEDNVSLFFMPIGWCDSTYLTSLYSLLIRVGRWYDPAKDIMTYLSTFKDFAPDTYLLNTAIPNIKNLFETKLFKQNWSIVKGDSYTHNNGICAYNNAVDLLK
jgi:hypothetical protein